MADIHDLKEQFSFVALLFTLVCYFWFFFLVLVDLWRAIRKRATWLPGMAISFTDITVQLIVWWTSLSNFTETAGTKDDVDILVVGFQAAVAAKVALCVFIGYSLPGMNAPTVKAFVALGITICFKIASEMGDFQKKRDETPEGFWPWAKVANSILFVCIVVLGLISICMVSGSQTIHQLMKKRISTMLSSSNEKGFQLPNERAKADYWNDYKDEVLSSWLVARVCRADYVISRSFFSSAVGVVVTISAIVSLLSTTSYNHSGSVIGLFLPIYSFTLIGWVVILFRWLSAQLYFSSHGHSWRRCFFLDDFWTRDTIDLIHMYNIKGDRQRFQGNAGCMGFLKRLPTKIFYILRLHKLLYLPLMLQWSVVFFSQLCGLLSEIVIGKFMYGLRTNIRKGHKASEKYEKVLKLVCMPREDPSQLWEANEMSLNKARRLMQKGYEKGRPSKELISIFRPHFLEWAEEGKRLLDKIQTYETSLVYKHFPDVEKQRVSITAVSLITVFIQLHKAKSDSFEKLLKACREVWDWLSFADKCDNELEADEGRIFGDLNKDKDQVGMAADKKFYKLQMEYGKLDPCYQEDVINVQEPRRITEDLLKNCECILKKENLLVDKEKKAAANLSDSKDWMEIAPQYNLYKLCSLMLDEDFHDFATWTKDALQNVIAFGMSSLPDRLVKKCWEWTHEFEEDKLWETIHLAGKCKAMVEALEA